MDSTAMTVRITGLVEKSLANITLFRTELDQDLESTKRENASLTIENSRTLEYNDESNYVRNQTVCLRQLKNGYGNPVRSYK
jgi:hypothetical protein